MNGTLTQQMLKPSFAGSTMQTLSGVVAFTTVLSVFLVVLLTYRIMVWLNDPMKPLPNTTVTKQRALHILMFSQIFFTLMNIGVYPPIEYVTPSGLLNSTTTCALYTRYTVAMYFISRVSFYSFLFTRVSIIIPATKLHPKIFPSVSVFYAMLVTGLFIWWLVIPVSEIAYNRAARRWECTTIRSVSDSKWHEWIAAYCMLDTTLNLCVLFLFVYPMCQYARTYQFEDIEDLPEDRSEMTKTLIVRGVRQLAKYTMIASLSTLLSTVTLLIDEEVGLLILYPLDFCVNAYCAGAMVEPDGFMGLMRNMRDMVGYYCCGTERKSQIHPLVSHDVAFRGLLGAKSEQELNDAQRASVAMSRRLSVGESGLKSSGDAV